MTWRSMVFEIVYFLSDAGFLQYIAAYWFSFMLVLAFYYCLITIITIPPVSLYKGGETAITELVSQYGQLIFRIMLDFQAQFQANAAELRQFCTIIFT